jgi:hypothetical protein
MTAEELELQRHRCEVRMLLEQGWPYFVAFVKGVKSGRGEEAAQRLWRDVREQHRLGNDGRGGKWLETPQNGDT